MKTAAKQPRIRRPKLLPGASVTMAMQMTGFSRPILEALIAEGRLAVVQFGPHRRIPLQAIDALIGDLGGFVPRPAPPLPTPAPAQSERRQRKAAERPKVEAKQKPKGRLAAAE
jgi:excisionase family DNA binding protein